LVQEKTMPLARIVTSNPDDAAESAALLREQGYIVEIVSPGASPERPADLVLNLDEEDVVLQVEDAGARLAAEFSETAAPEAEKWVYSRRVGARWAFAGGAVASMVLALGWLLAGSFPAKDGVQPPAPVVAPAAREKQPAPVQRTRPARRRAAGSRIAKDEVVVYHHRRAPQRPARVHNKTPYYTDLD
jgi:hypothetical protein